MADHVIESMKYLMTSCLTALAQMSMGQVLLRVLDRTLWIVEKSAQWSLPCHESPIEENGKSFHSMELVRPLPWVLFLPWLILLRLSRLTWNLGGVILGYPTIDPSDIVRYVQKTRRRLRTIKTNGIKTLRQKRIANNRPLEKSLQEANRSLIKSIQLTLSSLSCLDTSKSNHSPPSTRIQVSVNDEMSTTPDEKSATESTIVDQKRKYTQISSDDQESDESEEETLNSKIERLARENSFDDRDFQPGDSSETSESSQTDLEDEEKIISQHEVEGLLQENNALLDEYKLRSSNAILKTNSVKDTQSTCPTDNEKNPEIELAEEQPDYFSPQSGDDGDTAFYSPISSKSSSPERALPTFQGHQGGCELKGINDVKNNYSDGKIVEKSNGHVEKSGSSQTSNSNKCALKFQSKSHHKGKRMTHGSRKKK
ncbi:uncharacterized protein [Fopius arisanus]|uniref:Uncharacterized protein isoform X2 n=1 Tax=Fopius arisanus TaxID=64838 RepID=A0A9R1U6W2_9HYME|nr:PREDICTED: uncharacterized protein LOC105271059 isoform X2 [Fopius arisanus]